MYAGACARLCYCIRNDRSARMKMTQGILELPQMEIPPNGKPAVRVLDQNGIRLVFVGSSLLYQFDSKDKTTSRQVAVQLALSKHCTQKEVGKLWGVSTQTVFIWCRKFRESGVQGLAVGSPGRPRTVTQEQESRVLMLRGRKLKLTEISQQLQLPIGTVRTIIYSRPKKQDELFDVPVEVDEELGTDEPVVEVGSETTGNDEPAGATNPLNRNADRMWAVVGLLDDADPIFADCEHVEGAGALLGIALLSRDPFLDKIKAAYGSIGPAFYGLRTIFVALFLMALLRIKNPERNGKRNTLKLGRLLGLDRSPSTKTIRRKIRTLSGRGKALEVMRSLGEERLNETSLPEAVLYVDGHVKCYYGKGKIGKTFSTSKNRVVKGETDYWLNLGDGTPILCLPSELNDKMSTMLLRIVEDAKKICGGRRITVVFDRGGSSAAVYEKLTKAGCDFIAYHKKPKKIERGEFPEAPTVINGKSYDHAPVSREIELDIYVRSGKGKYKKTGRTQKVREVILLRDSDGGQTSVVTSRRDLTDVQILATIFVRWSQENYFKYLLEEYAFDHLCTYGTESLQEDHDRPNPEYVKLEKKISKLRSTIAGALGIPLEKLAADLSKGQSGKPDKLLTKKRTKTLQRHLDAVTEMKKRMSELPERINPEELRRLPQESRLVTNLVKMTAYVIEGKLASILKNLHNGVNGNERGLCSGFFQSTGSLLVEGEQLHVTLEKQGDPKRTELLAALCNQVNALQAIYPGSSLTMVFGVEK